MAETIQERRAERVATLRQLVAQLDAQYRRALAPHEQVPDAQMLLLKAEVEAAERPPDRRRVRRW